MAEQNQARPVEGPPGGRPFRFMVDYQVGDALPMFAKPHFQWKLNTEYMGRRFVYRPVSESTMDDARRMMERMRLTQGAVILAETQTAGRGRAGRAWVSPPDVNLYFTFLLFPEPAGLRPLAYVTPLAAALAIEQVSEEAGKKIVPSLKWPNDVLVDGRKLAGVLIEIDHMPDRMGAIVGVGINVNVDPDDYEEIAGIATSMKLLTGTVIAREEVLAAFCNHFESLYEEALGGSRRPFEQWKSRLVTLGKMVHAERGGLPLYGKAVDVEDDGALLIEREDGVRERVEAGDVLLVRS
jgi:BirA family biotin operon repressor/biotin-[acetyl-CoA-carboxylase] ligase